MTNSMRAWLGVAAAAVAGAALALTGCGGVVDPSASNGGGGTGTGGSVSSGGTTTTTGTGGTGGPKTCGGLAGTPCADDEYCDFPDDRCGGDDGLGECKPRPQGCDDIYMPVCACDGTVAGNDCSAYSNGQDVSILGGCTAPDGMFACGFGFCSTGSQYCRRSVSDVGGIPDSYACQQLPAACNGAPSCGCLAEEPCGNMCSEADGGLTLTCPGG